jgi:lipopolysaccharide exporter
VGVPAALVYSGRDIRRLAGTALSINVGLAAMLFAAVAALAPVLARTGGHPAIAPVATALGAGLVITAVGSVQNALLIKEMAFRRKYLPDVVPLIASGAASIVLAVLGWGVWSLVAGSLVRASGTTMLLWALSPLRPKPALDRNAAAELLRFGRHVSLASVLGYAVLNLDYFLIGRLRGPHDLGIYTVAFVTANLAANAIGQVASSVIFPACARLREDASALWETFSDTVVLVSALAVAAGGSMVICAPAYARVVLGAQWTGVEAPLRLLSVAGVILALDISFGAVYKALGRPDLVWRLIVLRLALLVPLMLLLLQHFGISGVAGSHAIVSLAMFPLGIVMLARLLGVQARDVWRRLLPAGVGAVVMAAVTLAAGALPFSRDYGASLPGTTALALLAVTAHAGVVATFSPRLVALGWARSRRRG